MFDLINDVENSISNFSDISKLICILSLINVDHDCIDTETLAGSFRCLYQLIDMEIKNLKRVTASNGEIISLSSLTV